MRASTSGSASPRASCGRSPWPSGRRDCGEAERRQCLTVMLEEGRRLTSLVTDFLDLQRLESGRQKLRLAPADPRRLLERAAEVAGPDPRRPIVIDAPADLPAILVDA